MITKMSRSILLVLLVAQCVSIAGCGAGEKIPAWANQALKEARENEGTIKFYGRVVDQYGQAVAGARVDMHVQGSKVLYMDGLFPPIKLKAVSDTNGMFAIGDTWRVIKGHALSFDGVFKEGYSESQDKGRNRANSRIYSKDSPDCFIPDKNNPVLFYLRKKELPPTFLLYAMDLRFGITTNESGKLLGYDFIQQRWIRDMTYIGYNKKPLNYDIQVKAVFDRNSSTWSVTMLPGGTNGGIIATNQLLYEAPGVGYQSELQIALGDNATSKKNYIYLRSRVPSIYTRIDIECINVGKEFFQLFGKSVTNPYGERNLEQAPDLPVEVTVQLKDEAIEAWQKNEYPIAPNLSKLIKAVK